jgi:hypothetical protein
VLLCPVSCVLCVCASSTCAAAVCCCTLRPLLTVCLFYACFSCAVRMQPSRPLPSPLSPPSRPPSVGSCPGAARFPRGLLWLVPPPPSGTGTPTHPVHPQRLSRRPLPPAPAVVRGRVVRGRVVRVWHLACPPPPRPHPPSPLTCPQWPRSPWPPLPTPPVLPPLTPMAPALLRAPPPPWPPRRQGTTLSGARWAAAAGLGQRVQPLYMRRHWDQWGRGHHPPPWPPYPRQVGPRGAQALRGTWVWVLGPHPPCRWVRRTAQEGRGTSVRTAACLHLKLGT